MHTPLEHLYRKLGTQLGKACKQYGLLNEGDKILIGLSGGKDSYALLELLARRRRIFAPRFELYATHVVMRNIPYLTDLNYIRELCHTLDVPLSVVETEFDPTTDHRKSPCFLCSWNRRKALFEEAKRLGCNKLGLGHHQDDILQTLLMNLTFQGAFGTMPPRLEMDKFDMTLVRPMCLIKESQLIELAKLRNYPTQIKSCPYETDSNRSNIKAVFEQLETLSPHLRSHLWNAMHNIQPQYLPQQTD